MTTITSKILPSHASGSQVRSSELPIIQQNDMLLISGKLLHKKLKVKTLFANWIQRRIEKFGFEENQDYFPNLESKKTGRGGHNAKDYFLSVDMAKEMAMLEENETGRNIRRYFIQKEKEARGISQLPKEVQFLKGLKAKRINDRLLYLYVDVRERAGYSRSAGGSHRARYWNHFVKEGNLLYVTQEFALHMYHQKRVMINRQVMKAMQPVLPFNFGDTSLLNTGGRHV